MFQRPLFDVFHDGYWYSSSDPSPPPKFYAICPAQNDSRRIAEWKLTERGLKPRDQREGLGYGIPYVGDISKMLISRPYTKSEIMNFLSALGFSPYHYDYNSVEVFIPKDGYTQSPPYSVYLSKVRASMNRRSVVERWLS